MSSTTTDSRPRTKAAKRMRWRDNRTAYLFLAPWFFGLFALTAVPILASFVLSFTDYNLLNSPEWTGLENYTSLPNDAHYLNSIRVTFTYVIASVPLSVFFALLVAVALSGKRRGVGVYRSVYYLPSLMGGSVAVAMLWRQIFGPDGLINAFLAWFGIDGPSWISHPDYALWTLIILNVWQFGAPMLIFLAGIKQIPAELLEAAAVDGAGRVRRFFSITMPMLSPLIFFNLVLNMINAFKAFTSAYVVSAGTGGPADATLFYTLNLYVEAFTNLKMGYASAQAWVLLVIIGLFTAGMFLTSRYWVYYADTQGNR